RRRHTRFSRDWSSDVCSSDLAQAFEKARPVMEHYARALNLMGPAGSGQKTKMVNQIAIAGLVQGLSEALHFAEQAELDVRKVVRSEERRVGKEWRACG